MPRPRWRAAPDDDDDELDDGLSDVERWQQLGSKGGPSANRREGEAAAPEPVPKAAFVPGLKVRNHRPPAPRERPVETEELRAYYSLRSAGLPHSQAEKAVRAKDPVVVLPPALARLRQLRLEDEQMRPQLW